MKSKIVFWIDKGKRTKTITEYICPECEQRYWFTEEGFCIVCGTKLTPTVPVSQIVLAFQKVLSSSLPSEKFYP